MIDLGYLNYEVYLTAGLTGSFLTSPLPLPCGRLIGHKALVEALYALSTGSHPQDPWLKSCFIEPAYNCRIANGPWWDSNPGPFRPESGELGKCNFGWFLAYPPRSIGKVVGEIREFGPEGCRGRYNS